VISINARPYNCRTPRGRNIYRCLGAAGLSALAKALHGRRGRFDRSVALLAGRLGVKAVIPALRRVLKSPRRVWDLGTAAEALALLGDRQSAPTLAAAVRRYANTNATVWRKSWRSLATLDLKRAVRVARDVLKLRAPKTTWDRSRVREALPVLVRARARLALPALRRWSKAFAGRRGIPPTLAARILGARMRLGDKPLLAAMQRKLGTRNAAVPVHPHHVVAGLGGSAADIPALLRFAGAGLPEGREAFDAIGRLIPKLSSGDRGRLRAGLAKLSAYRRKRRQGSQAARHFGALARLGDASASKELLALARGPVRWPSSWVAAKLALEAQLSGAAKVATQLLRKGKLWRARGNSRQYKRQLIEGFARSARGGAKHAGWAVALLDWNVNERYLALSHFARIKPAGACAVIGKAAYAAHPDGVHDALVALTLLGQRCRPMLERLASGKGAPKSVDARQLTAVRGTALETLAMLGAGSARINTLAAGLAPTKRDYVGRAYLRRALEIVALRARTGRP
jgi:hypothetical protein